MNMKQILKAMTALAEEAIAVRRESANPQDHELLSEYEEQHAEAEALLAALPDPLVAPFALPVRLESGRLLLAEDAELIECLRDSTPAERAYIVQAVNAWGHA